MRKRKVDAFRPSPGAVWKACFGCHLEFAEDGREPVHFRQKAVPPRVEFVENRLNILRGGASFVKSVTSQAEPASRRLREERRVNLGILVVAGAHQQAVRRLRFIIKGRREEGPPLSQFDSRVGAAYCYSDRAYRATAASFSYS